MATSKPGAAAHDRDPRPVDGKLGLETATNLPDDEASTGKSACVEVILDAFDRRRIAAPRHGPIPDGDLACIV
jgi:hypothetical protein